MAETRECDVCSSIVKHIPAGTSGPRSKNPGTPYSDFWVCSNDNCSSRQRSTQNTQTPAIPQPSENNSTMNGSIATFEVLQNILKVLEDIKEQVVAGNTFFRSVKDDKPSVESKYIAPPATEAGTGKRYDDL